VHVSGRSAILVPQDCSVSSEMVKQEFFVNDDHSHTKEMLDSAISSKLERVLGSRTSKNMRKHRWSRGGSCIGEPEDYAIRRLVTSPVASSTCDFRST
jgi:hypothetical protein